MTTFSHIGVIANSITGPSQDLKIRWGGGARSNVVGIMCSPDEIGLPPPSPPPLATTLYKKGTSLRWLTQSLYL